MLERMGILWALGVALLLPAGAQAASDVAATHAYIQANNTLARAAVARIPAGQAAIDALDHKLAAECPRAGAGAPINAASFPMSEEVTVALWSVSWATGARSIAAFAKAVKPLHWSNARITRIARRYATSLQEMATIPLPSLCTDVRAFAASGFKVVPASIIALDKRVLAIELETVPQKLLAPFERGGDRAAVARTEALEHKFAEAEFVKGQDDLIRTTELLGLPE
jgi:hypothetical protein